MKMMHRPKPMMFFGAVASTMPTLPGVESPPVSS